MKTYDTHAHLDQLNDLDNALEEAARAGVIGIVAMSMDLASCRNNLQIKNKYQHPEIYLAMGMHPAAVGGAHCAPLKDLEDIVGMIHDHKDRLHAVGEIGLDFWYKWVRKDEEKKNEQRQVFRRFLEAARELELPAVIHSRGAWKECLQMALDVGVKKAEFHWYSGPVDVLEEILRAGYFVSTSPSVAYSPQSQEAMRHAPIERTLIETDCPVSYRNEDSGESFEARPKDVFRTLKAYCALKGIDEEKALTVLNENTREFFDLNSRK
jgi:TatD DNase family protein